MRAAPRSPATRAAESARCAHSRSATSSGSKKSDSAESLDDCGTAGTVEVLSTAAPGLAPVAAAVPRGALTRVRRTRAIGSGRAPLASLGERFFLLERTPLAEPLELSVDGFTTHLPLPVGYRSSENGTAVAGKGK